MKPLSEKELREIAKAHGISYSAISDRDPLMVRTRMARAFPVSQDVVFDAFSDPIAHVPLFSIIKSSTPPIRYGIEGVLPKNQFFAFEHVEEGNLPPRLMLVRYSLKPPTRIVKEAVTDPFRADDATAPGRGKKGTGKGKAVVRDAKKGRVVLSFRKLGPESTRITTESWFRAETGAVFARGFIDRVWLNFFERMMVVNGIITEDEMRTGPMR